ncbi:MAG TPA: multiheme c-type cytochrome [Kofleriaceae bacterium]|nr:multiheme c-type cytochrome [Kofleriaceae bacterium]
MTPSSFRIRSEVATITIAGVALLACGGSSTSAPPSGSAPAKRAAWDVRPLGGAQPIDPGIAAGAASPLLDASGCASCHAEIVAEWSTSRHALAWTNGIFQREYSERPLAWCVNCHAPLTTQQAGQYKDRGVDCATCHVRAGALVSAHKRPGSPHQTVADPSFGSPAFCADCHQFTFPVLGSHGEATRMTAHPMQTTISSFNAGPYAHERDGCMACHGSRKNHAFLGGHDPGMRNASIEVAWCTRGERLEVSVKNTVAGHAVPTGDIHRHMNLRIWRSSAPEALFEAFYGRRFEPDDAGGKRTVWDSTIAPGQTRQHTLALADLGGAPGEPLNLELTYVFLENEQPRADRAPSEPFTASIVRWRKSPGELQACP